MFPGGGDPADIKKISLRYNQTRIRFELGAMNFLFHENNSFRYKMSGVDNDTVYMENYHPVEYAGLKPGRYRFWFTGSNNDNVWNKEGKSIEIIVSPPVTRSVIAFITYVILFALLVTVFVLRHYRKLIYDKKLLEKEVQIRTVELEQKNREIEQLDRMKTRFFTEISHEFRTPLSLIMGPVDTLLADKGLNDNYGRNRLMKIIKRNSMRLLNLVNQLARYFAA